MDSDCQPAADAFTFSWHGLLRIFFLSLATGRCATLFLTFRTLLQACGLRAAPCAAQGLMHNEAQAVKAELEARGKRFAGQKPQRRKLDHNPASPSAASPVQGSQWVEQHMADVAAAELRWGQQPPEGLQTNRAPVAFDEDMTG